MENYALNYVYNGNKLWDVVAAESPEDAIEWFEHQDSGRHVFNIGETDEAPTHTVTAEELEEIRKPFWEKRGANSEEELLAYTAYCTMLDNEAYAKFCEEHPEEDPEGAYEAEIPTIEEWRARRDGMMNFDEAIRNVCNDTIEWNIEACEIVCQEAGLKSEFDSAGGRL